jgi:2-iminobutanoate/2-iminopropanoate deaminase
LKASSQINPSSLTHLSFKFCKKIGTPMNGTRKYITTGPCVPRLTSPISHAVCCNGVCYISGQLSVDETGRYINGTVSEEAERAFNNLLAVLRVAGLGAKDLTFVDVALIDMTDLPLIDEVFMRVFPGERPARTMYQPARLPHGAKVKVMGVAVAEAT